MKIPLLNARIRRAVPFITLAGIFSFLLIATWNRWGNFDTDTFRDQWIFYKLSRGAVLYKDIFYEYGFLPPQVMALVYRVFGVHITYSLYIGVAITACTSYCMYKIARLFFNRIIAVTLTAQFLFVFAFHTFSSLGFLNFILPYSIASTFFIMFLMGSLLYFIRYLRVQNRRYAIVWILMLSLAFLCRIELTFACWFIFSFIVLLNRKRIKNSYRIILFPLCAATLCYAVFLMATHAFEGFNNSYCAFLKSAMAGKSYFELHAAGLLDLRTNLLVAIGSFIVHCISLSFFLLVSAYYEKMYRGSALKKKAIALLFYVIAGMYSYALMLFVQHEQFSGMLFILGFSIVLCGFRYLRAKETDRKVELASYVTLCLIAAVLLMRIVLRLSPHGHGFFLLLPGLIAYYLFCIRFFPWIFSRAISLGERGQRQYAASVLIFIVFLSWPFIDHSKKRVSLRDTKTIHPELMDLLFWDTQWNQRHQIAAHYLKNHCTPDQALVVFPLGVYYNFVTQLDNPLPYVKFEPHFVSFYGEQRIIDLLKQHNVDCIIINNLLTDYCGAAYFGVDYAQKITDWIKVNYILEANVGCPHDFYAQEYCVKIYRRKSSP